MPDDVQPRFVGDDPDPEPSAAAPAARKPAGPRFKRDDEAAAGRRTTAVVVALLLLAGLGGVAVGLALYLKSPPRPRLLTVHVPLYDRPGWGVAAGARADADRLVAAFAAPDDGRTADADRNFLQADKLRTRLSAVRRELTDATAADRPFVLSVSALAAVRPDGAVCLLPTDADPFDPAAWVPLDDVLTALSDAAPGVRRLLLLDLARPTADPFLGRPAEVASAAVCELLDRRRAAGTLPCPVLAAAGPGEVSWPAPRGGGSAFGLYLSDGLGGAAVPPDGSDVRVSDLAGFIVARVSRYARRVHGQPQTPRLFAPADDWDFTLVRNVTAVPPAVSEEPAKPEEYAYPKALRDAWAEWDALLAADADRRRPEGFARLTAGLRHAERVWLGADDAGFAGKVCGLALEEWRKADRGQGAAGPPADDAVDPKSFAQKLRVAARDGPAPSPELAATLDGYVSAAVQAPDKPDQWKAEKKAWADKAADPAAVRLVWQRLTADDALGRPRLRVLGEALADLTKGEQPPPFEPRLAGFLAGRKFSSDQGLNDFPEAAVAAWLRAEDRLGKALAAGAGGFDDLRPALDAADLTRQEGVRMLLTADTRAKADAAAERLRAAAAGYERATVGTGAGPKAAAVPGLLRAVLWHQESAGLLGPPEFDQWLAAADLCDRLMGAGRLDPAAAARLADEAAVAAKKLADRFTPARAEALEKKPAPWDDPATVQEALALASGPGLPADWRAKLWALVRREWWRRHDDTRKLDADDLAGLVPTSAPPATTADPDPADRRRAVAADRLLRLAFGRAATPAGWHTRGPDEAKKAVDRRDWELAGRLVRVVPPSVAALGRDMPPADVLARPATADRTAYREWVRTQFRTGYQVPVRSGGRPLLDALDPNRELVRSLTAAD